MEEKRLGGEVEMARMLLRQLEPSTVQRHVPLSFFS